MGGLQASAELCLSRQDPPLPGKADAYQKGLEESYQEQCRLAAEQKKALLETLAEQIAQGRAKKRQKREEEGEGEGEGEGKV